MWFNLYSEETQMHLFEVMREKLSSSRIIGDKKGI